MSNYEPFLANIHDAKISICYLLAKINKPIRIYNLYSIIEDSKTMDFFMFSEAIEELKVNENISVENDTIYILDKCRVSASYFEKDIHPYFKKQLVKSAFYYLSNVAHMDQANVTIEKTSHGYEVTCVISDNDFDLLRLTLFTPDETYAEFVKNKIYDNPLKYYQNIVDLTINNKEVEFDNDLSGTLKLD